ncbi:MAG: ABC transporter ATP-binding protein [Helicobacteraceae bacterium]|jgi:ATP-binding cassette subfamily C protein|nr:ABC transporter ATP-binding protein [Helicobacteraceae bacterium]
MKQITWSALLYETKPYRSKIIIAQFIALLAVIVSLPIPLLFPLLIDQVILDKPAELVAAMKTLFDPSEPYYYILIILAVTLFLRMVYVILNVVQLRLFIGLSKSIVFVIRRRLLSHLEKVSVSEYEALGGGGVSAKMVTDIDTVDAFIGVSISKFAVSLFSLTGIAFILLYINWKLGLMILVINPLVLYLTVFLGRRVRKLKKIENQRVEAFQNDLSETLDLFVQIRAFNQEKHYIKKMISNAKAIKEASTSFGWKSEAAGQLSGFVFLSGFEFFRASAMIMVLFSDLSLGEMFAVLGYLWFMVTPLQDFLQIIFSYQNANSAIERLNALLTLKQEPQYAHKQNPFKESETNTLRLENVYFSYGEKEVLHNISMEIPKGKTVALLGPSGSGKSTLAQIILGLYANDKGTVYVDEVPIDEIGLDQLRDHIALVLQSPRMFNDTLRQNLTLGREVDEEALFQAISIAQLDTVLEKLTNGLDTMIGKEGVRLSGGERQRLAIARMLVHRPNLVILDESTSALDVHTEKNLFTSLCDFLVGKSMLIIAHRLSSVEHADYIYVLDQGRIVESGSPVELMQKQGYYHKFVTEQR